MTVAIVIAAIAIVAGVVFVAIGRGGELSVERPDYAPLELGPVSATDVALLRPPTALWGYNAQATDEALDRIAAAIRERDVRIVTLEQLVTDLNRDPALPPVGDTYVGARRRRDALEPGPEAPAAWQAGTEPSAAVWQAGTEPRADWQAGTEPTADWQAGTEPTADWQAGTEPTADRQAGTEPTADWQAGTEPSAAAWQAGTEPTADRPAPPQQPPEQSHD